MFSDKPPILIEIKPKTHDCNSSTNVTSKESQKNVEEAENRKSQGNIQKTVRFSCPQANSDKSSGSNSANISRLNKEVSLTGNYIKHYRKCTADQMGTKIRDIHHSNISRVRKKVRLRVRRNVGNQLGKYRTNSVAKYEHEISSKFNPKRKFGSHFYNHSDRCNRKLSRDSQRRKGCEAITEKERESNAKITRDSSQSRERAVREMPSDKTWRYFNKRNFKYNAQKKCQGSLGKKSKVRKGNINCKTSRKYLAENIQSKIFTGKTFNSNTINVPKHTETSDDQNIRHDELSDSCNHKQKYFWSSQVEDSFNSQEPAGSELQKTIGDSSEECFGSESNKIVRRIKKDIWDIDHRRSNLEKIAFEIRNDIAKTLCTSNQKPSGDYIEENVSDCFQRVIRDPIQKNTRISISQIDGKFVQGSVPLIPTKIKECQRNTRDNRKRNLPMLHRDLQSKFHSSDKEHYAESSITQQSQKSSKDNALTWYKNTQENGRKYRSDDHAPIRNVSPRDIRNTKFRSVGSNLEKKPQISLQKSVRPSRNANSEGSRKRCAEVPNSTYKHFMDGSQKVFRCSKNEKNDREVLRQNDNSCSTKNNLEETKHRVSVFDNKNELGIPHKKGYCGNGKRGRESTCKVGGDSHKSVSVGHDNNFWDFYRTNVWDYSREVPRNKSWYGSPRRDVRDCSRKSIRAISQKSFRHIRKNGYRYSREDFRDDEKKTIAHGCCKNINSNSCCCINSCIQKNVSTDDKICICESKKNVIFEGSKSTNDSRKNVCVGSRKNIRDASSKILRDVSPRDVCSDIRKNIRREQKHSCLPSQKGIFDGSWKHERSVLSKAPRCKSPATSGNIRESHLRAGSPKTFWDRAWSHVRSCSPSSTHVDAPKIGYHSCALLRKDSPKSPSLTPRLRSTSDKSQAPCSSSSKTGRQQSGNVFRHFPWPAEYMYRPNFVGDNTAWDVLGESKPNSRIRPVFCHPTDRYANTQIDVLQNKQYQQSGYPPDDTRAMVQSSKKPILEVGVHLLESYQPVARDEQGKSMERYSQAQDSYDATRTTDEKFLDAHKKNPQYHLGKNVKNSGKSSRQLQRNTWDSCPWVVRSTWGIHDNQCQGDSQPY